MLIWSAETGFGYLHLRGNREGGRDRRGLRFRALPAVAQWDSPRGACVRAGVVVAAHPRTTQTQRSAQARRAVAPREP